MTSPWSFVVWGMDFISPIEPSIFNGHRFMLLVINYFTKWMEATFHKVVTIKVVVVFPRTI